MVTNAFRWRQGRAGGWVVLTKEAIEMPVGRDAHIKLQNFIFRRAELSLRPPPKPFAYERCQYAEAAEPGQAEPDENQRTRHIGR